MFLLFFFILCMCFAFFFFFFSSRRRHTRCGRDWSSNVCSSDLSAPRCSICSNNSATALRPIWSRGRSGEHTSELQSRPHLVCRLLLEKKKRLTRYGGPACSAAGADRCVVCYFAGAALGRRQCLC